MKKKEIKSLSQLLLAVAVLATILAGVGYLGFDIWLASTQWLLVAAVTALFAVYTRMES